VTVSERPDPVTLPAPAVEFVTVRHLATLTTLRPDGSPHVVPVGFTWDADAGVARGELHVTSGDLSKLIGRPTTPLRDAIAVALAG
jgi:hypothetical protein